MTQKQINKVIEKVFYRRVIKSGTVGIDEISNWFPEDEAEEVEELARKMVEDDDIPLTDYGHGENSGVHLTGVTGAILYLDRHGGRVPFGFDDVLD